MYVRLLKRALDAMVATLALVALSPLLLLVVAAIRIEDRSPAIFRQQRVGRDERVFTIFKFRSMPFDTPNVPSASATKLKVTRVGRVIRRTNMDELPQLWNVLRGDMSLIGPRPALPTQISLLDLRQQRGVNWLRPGLTGLAQVNSYDGMPETEKVSWDERYSRSVSLVQDMKILIRTASYLLRRPPAY